MKTIEVSDEIYNKLIEISKEMNSQSNRATAMPYFFQVQTKHQIACPEGSGTQAWFFDGDLVESDEQVKEVIYNFYDGEKTKEEIDDLNSWDLEFEMERLNYRKVWYGYENRYENCFFTEKACKEHIERNRHNLSSPVDFLTHAFRNPEMELISKFLVELTGGKIHK